jgi:hypothetical protein
LKFILNTTSSKHLIYGLTGIKLIQNTREADAVYVFLELLRVLNDYKRGAGPVGCFETAAASSFLAGLCINSAYILHKRLLSIDDLRVSVGARQDGDVAGGGTMDRIEQQSNDPCMADRQLSVYG